MATETLLMGDLSGMDGVTIVCLFCSGLLVG
jgi:hypothetical protein